MDALIQTKLHAPPQRVELLARPHLLARLRAGLQGPLTLVAAPAGFGKSTLAAAALAAVGRGAAWLSLDEGDNDSSRFLAYLLAALQIADPALGEAVAGLLAGPQPAPPPVVLTQMINYIAGSGADVVLILDDYHVIRDADVQGMVAFLLEHAPPQLHLVLLTRADPPLPLARLRARGQLVELRAADLRLTPQETGLFLNAVLQLGLPPDLVTLLQERTEGWIAGLQLAALRLRSQPVENAEDAAAFVRAFSGANRYILDYLLEEVLQRQPPALQRFLLLTSPLPRLCGPLCDAVLQAAGAPLTPGEQPASAALLVELERSNVFLAPLDDERCWYRYHPLFADLLRARLRERYGALEPQLHSAAGVWLEQQGLTVQAVDAALAAGDPLWAARLVEQNTVGLLAAGELAALLSWIGALPPAVRRERPGLCIQAAYALAFAGRLAEADAALNQAEYTALNAAQAGAVAAVRAMLVVMAGQEAEALALAGRALELLPLSAAWDRAAAYWAMGYARRSLGDGEGARACFGEQVRLARGLGNVWTLVTGLTDLALASAAEGERGAARLLLQEALQSAAKQGARGSGYIARTETALAALLCDEGELGAAAALLAAAFDHVGRWPNPNHIVYAHLVAARVQQARGDLCAAEACLEQAQAACQSAPVTTVLRRQVEDARRKLPSKGAGAQAQLVEPLSERECEVLALLAEGLSNSEIAARLIIALGTVKAHTAAIYRKLDVANRTEAAARARRLGIL